MSNGNNAVPLYGATVLPTGGVNFRVFTDTATGKLELLHFAEPTGVRHRSYEMQIDSGRGTAEHRDWTLFLPDAGPGDRYALRAYGRYDPRLGFRHDPSKVLADPAAQIIDLDYRDNPANFSLFENGKLVPRDNIAFAPKCVIAPVDNFDWGDAPSLFWGDEQRRAVIYEAPMRGLSIKLDLSTDASLVEAQEGLQIEQLIPGTYAAAASDRVIEHLQRLCVTHLEVYVVQQSLNSSDPEKSHGGDWNYNPLLLGAPDNRYASTPQDPLSVIWEFQYMVRRLLRAGIQPIIDVVYNHTLEGNDWGETFSLKGLDNHVYWLREPDLDDPSRYENWSGCGNAINYYHQRMRELALQTLRRWVEKYRVGFRFDLMGTVLRNERCFDDQHPLLLEMNEDQIISSATPLIVEPWSARDYHSCYCHLPEKWLHWSDRGRRAFRKFWLGAEGVLGEYVQCLTGQRDQYPPAVHGWFAMVSTAFTHDGFNLAQWLMHNEKCNEHDGDDENISFDCGVDGETTDPEVLALRWRIWKAAWASLAFAPMTHIRAGDEALYYPGNADNNIYDRGDAVNGVVFNANPEFLAFSQRVMQIRERFANLGQLRGLSKQPFGCYGPSGHIMKELNWQRWFGRTVSLFIPEDPDSTAVGAERRNLLLIVNSDPDPIPVLIPWDAQEMGLEWEMVLQTGLDDPFAALAPSNGQVEMEARSVSLLVST